MTSLLEITDLNVSFRGSKGPIRALRDVNLTVPRNRIVGVVGESGSGKSTLLWAILGLLARNADISSGQILYKKSDLLQLSDADLRAIRGEEISMIFQDPMTSQIPLLSFRTQLNDILYRRDMTTRQKTERALDLLGKVAIPDPKTRIRQFPHHFSGGMRQRAGIAMALLTEPNLLLADEPTTALDVTMEAQIIHLLRKLQQEMETSILLVSHNLGLVAELCDDVVVMYAGEVVETGTVHQIFNTPQHPYTRALLDCDPARLMGKVDRLPVIHGDLPDMANLPAGCIYADRCDSFMEVCSQQKPTLAGRKGGAFAACHLPEAPGGRLHATAASPAGAAPPPVTDQPDHPPLLEARNIRVRFPAMPLLKAKLKGIPDRFVDAVLDVSLRIRSGETVTLVGESGSGKTTFGRAVLNLVQAQEGEVFFQGERISDLSPGEFKRMRRNMALMLQDPVGSLSPRMSVGALLAEPFRIHGIKDMDFEAEAVRLADIVRLPRTYLTRYPHELSGGQARRVGVARALALRPKLIIADEPTAGLDVSVQGGVLNLLSDLQADYGLGFLLITHNLPVIRHVSDRLAIMYMGRIVEEGPTDVVFKAPRHPYTKALIDGIPQPDPARRRTDLAIRGEVPSLLNRPRGCEFAARCPFAQDHCRTRNPAPQAVGTDRAFSCHFPIAGSTATSQ